MTVTLTNGTLTNGSLVAFSPLTYGPDVWYDSNDLTTITRDASNNVSQWDDKSGNGNHATQGIGADQPSVVFNDLDNKNVINFDRTNSEWLDTTYNWPLIFTIFIVVRPEDITTINTRPLSSYDGGGDLVSGEYALSIANSSKVVFFLAGTIAIISSTLPSANVPYLITLTSTGGSGGTAEMFVNGISQGTQTNNSTTVNHAISIGEDDPAGATEFFLGDISEIIIDSSLWTTEQISKTEKYLNNKWGI